MTPPEPLRFAEYVDALTGEDLDDVPERLGRHVVVALDGRDAPPPAAQERFMSLPVVVVGTAADPVAAGPGAAVVDVVLADADPVRAEIAATVARNPIAATSLCLLLRGADDRSVGAGLVAESATYSTLQAGPEFAAWLAGRRPPGRRPDDSPTVRLDRCGDRLCVALSRPAVRNALNRRMRDELTAALGVAVADRSIAEVIVTGDGAAFCAGGDLDEFGSLDDPASAHLVRLRRSPARLLAAIADRATARIHGACYGSGIELPAFARRVVADPGTAIALPEVRLGLIPGAGGTVSLPRRIGRHRTAQLALATTPVDASTALAWGLVDAVEPVS